MINDPNVFAVLPDDRWVITSPNAQTLWMSLEQEDSLGQRRYVPAVGATLDVIFQRRDAMTQSGGRLKLTNTPQTVTKTATVSPNDGSQYSFNLTNSDIEAILGGTVKFKLTEGANTTEWVQNWALKKNLTTSGS